MTDKKPPGLIKGIAANLLSNGSTALFGVIFLPLYLRVIGSEGYGLVGVYALLSACIRPLEHAISGTLTREVARHRGVGSVRSAESRVIYDSLEMIAWVAGTCCFIAVALAADFLATHLIHPKSLTQGDVRECIFLMALAMALQFPFNLHASGLLGRERHLTVTVLTVTMGIIRGVGSVVVLFSISPRVQAYFLWQIIVGLGGVIVVQFIARHRIPRLRIAVPKLPRHLWHYGAGLSLLSAGTALFSYTDRAIVTMMLPLSVAGEYNVAAVAATGLYLLAVPVNTVILPKLTALTEHGQSATLIELYHTACQLQSLLVLGFGSVMGLFASEVLLIWTGDPLVARNAAGILSLLILAAYFQALQSVFGSLQLAYGQTRAQTALQLFWLLNIPFAAFMVSEFGAVGAALSTCSLSLCQLLTGKLVVLIDGLTAREKRIWLMKDVGRPLLCILTVLIPYRILISPSASRLQATVHVMFGFSMALTIGLWATPTVRRLLLDTFGFRGNRSAEKVSTELIVSTTVQPPGEGLA